jgi:hypothetical protein
LVTRFAFSEIALTQGEHRPQHFPAYRTALLAKGDVPFGKRVSLRFRHHRRRALDKGLRDATQPEVACDRFLLAYLSRFHPAHLLIKLMKDL